MTTLLDRGFGMCTESFELKEDKLNKIKELLSKRIISEGFGKYLITLTGMLQEIEWAMGALYAGMANASIAGLNNAQNKLREIYGIYPQEERENPYSELVRLAEERYNSASKLINDNITIK